VFQLTRCSIETVVHVYVVQVAYVCVYEIISNAYANQTLSEAVVFLHAPSVQSSVARVYDDVSDYVTGAVSDQQRDPDGEQEIPR